MDTNKRATIGSICRLRALNVTQAIEYTMKTRCTTIDNGVLEREGMLTAEVVPEGLLVGGQNENKMYARDSTLESLQRVHQDWTSAYGQKLLRQVTTHSQATASGDYNHILVHLTSLHSMPCLNASAVALSFKSSTMA